MGAERAARVGPAAAQVATAAAAARPRTAATGRLGVHDLQRLQGTAGNAAVAALVRSSPRPGRRPGFPPVVQRSPDTPHTLTWEVEDSSKDRAILHRTTKIEADAWGEVGPAPPRVRYDRRVDLRTPDGITVTLRVNVTIYLRPGEKLPATAEEALRRAGHHVSGGRYFTATGGSVVRFDEDRYYNEDAAVSMQQLSAGFPDYALLALTAPQQEAAILRKLAHLPRRDTGVAGAGVASGEEGKPTLRERLTQAGDLITDFVPGVSNVKDFVTFLTGVNPVTGEKVGRGARILALIFAIPGVGSALKYLGKVLMRPLLKMGMKLAAKSRALVKWIATSKAAVWLTKAGRGVWHRTSERAGRAAEKLGLRTARVGHATPWDTMTKKQQGAFQHSYSNHGHEFGLPNWSGKNAESLRQQFNAAAGAVREKAQQVSLRYKPVGGVTEPVRYFQYTDDVGTRWYYFETLRGDFVSAGLETK